MSKGYPQYKPGAKWRVERNRDSFTFVIIGLGSKPDRKLCRVQFDKERWGQKNRDFEAEYTHAHLKRYGVYQQRKNNGEN